MQALKRYKNAFFSIFIAVILVISAVVIFENFSAEKPNPTTTPTPKPTLPPTQHPPTPTHTTTIIPTIRPTVPGTLQPTPEPSILPGEVTTYQGISLTYINGYINYLIEHPDVAIAGTQHIDPTTYRLAITGMVNNATNYTYDQIVNGYNSTLQVATLPCVEGWSVTLLWQGIPLMDILNRTGASSDATTLIFIASDGYSTALPIEYVKQNNIMIAYKMNNLTLTPTTGWPFFLVAKNQYGYKWIEWITEINVSSDDSYLGYWESRGYPNDATVRSSQIQPLISIQNLLPAVAVSVVCAAAAVGALLVWKKRKLK